MKVNTIMHIAFYTDNLEEMIDFYVNKLGFTYKYDVRYKVYLNREDRPSLRKYALEHPEEIFNVYIEVSDGQFIELFPSEIEMKEHPGFNECKGYSHFAFTVEDIYKTREELLSKGVEVDSEISKGPSETYHMWVHDPDGNKFEIMQLTKNSWQITGNSEG